MAKGHDVPRGAVSAPVVALSKFTVYGIAGVVSNPEGATVPQLIAALGVSRTTALRWLSLMESEGLLERQPLGAGHRGRPRMVYRPTVKLLEAARAHALEKTILFNHASLKIICKYNSDGRCLFDETKRVCEAAACPVLNPR